MTSPRHGGTGREYLIERISEVDPALAARVRRREISAYAAARSLDLTLPRISLAGHDPDTIADALRRYLPPDVRLAVAERLAGEPS